MDDWVVGWVVWWMSGRLGDYINVVRWLDGCQVIGWLRGLAWAQPPPVDAMGGDPFVLSRSPLLVSSLSARMASGRGGAGSVRGYSDTDDCPLGLEFEFRVWPAFGNASATPFYQHVHQPDRCSLDFFMSPSASSIIVGVPPCLSGTEIEKQAPQNLIEGQSGSECGPLQL